MSLNDTNQMIAAALGGATLLVVIIGWLRWFRPRWRRVRQITTAVTETILGREAIIDAATGATLVPVQPGLGLRLATQEHQMDQMTDAVAKIAGSHERLDALEGRVTALELAHVHTPHLSLGGT